jgi:signal transduction histidine kinase
MPLRSPIAGLASTRLRTQLMLTYALVLVVDVAIFALTVALLAPQGPDSPSFVATDHSIRQYSEHLGSVLITALIVGIGLSLATAVLAAILINRLIVRPLEHVRTSARHMTDGHYDTRVPVPRPPELAGIAGDLNTLAARLSETEKRRVRLVSDLAHELRTPLTILRGQIDGLADGLYEPSQDLVGSMSEEVERLRRLTSELSQLSRAEENVYQLQPRETDLAILAHTVAGRLGQEFGEHGVTLAVAAAGPALAVVDPDRVSQILVNLLTNALAACDRGDQVTVSLDHEAGFLALRVADTGGGIAAGDLELIFERFERRTMPGHPAPHRGSGIGLTIARALAQAHGGTLTAQSAGPGRGATFILTLPLTIPALTGQA